MRALLLTAALVAGLVSPAMAKVINVQMKNKGSQPGQYMVFEPAFIKASVGDTIKFLPTNPGISCSRSTVWCPQARPSSPVRSTRKSI